MPRILGTVVDSLNRLESSVRGRYHEVSRFSHTAGSWRGRGSQLQAGVEELKTIIGKVSELRYQMQTDKAMEPIARGPDVQQWNSVFEVYRKELSGKEPTWFSVSWLFAECFMYRKIAEIIQTRQALDYSQRILFIKDTLFSSILKDLDPFSSQKQDSFKAFLPQLCSLAHFLLNLLQRSHKDTHMEFQHLLLVYTCHVCVSLC